MSRFVHPEPALDPGLRGLEFLIGSFRGDGWFGTNRSAVAKRVRGRWVGGRRHIALEMIADYRTDDDRIDRHSAFVVVSAPGGALASRAFTDDGRVVDFLPILADGRLVFDDRVPHGLRANRARKVLEALPSGYDEALEVDFGDGRFVPFSRIELRRDENPP